MKTHPVCIIEGCGRTPRKSDGRICYICKNRFHRHGDYNISPNWTVYRKGQPCLTKYGYIRINIEDKRVLEHRYIMEKHLGRKLLSSERVHHINGVRTDNRVENLELFSNHADHQKLRHKESWKKRTDIHKYSIEEISKIIERLNTPSIGVKHIAILGQTCFCGKPIKTRNLCSTHYCWASRHRFL